MPNERSVEHARWVTEVLQKILGLSIAICILARIVAWFSPRLFYWLPAPYSSIEDFFAKPVLDIVAGGLGVSAGLDLAFMLFTPGPDEAFAPLIKGIAATILLMASDDKTLGFGKAAAMALLAALIMGLYVFCYEYDLLGERKHEPSKTGGSEVLTNPSTPALNASDAPATITAQPPTNRPGLAIDVAEQAEPGKLPIT